MEEYYVPKYISGEIIVCFKKEYDEKSFVIALSKELGFEYTFEKFNEENEFHIIKVPEGKEIESIEKFQKINGRFIRWAERRDLKFEERIKFQRGLENLVGSMDESALDKNFNSLLEEMKTYINNFKN